MRVCFLMRSTTDESCALRNCLLCFFLLACSSSKSADQEGSTPQLELIASYELALSEPSGLALGAQGTVLWAVGNSPELVYKLTVDGQLLDTLAYGGDDLEGIVFDPADSTLWIVEEEKREIVQLDQGGNVLRRRRLGLSGERNSGLEGIGLDSGGGLHLLNEKNPGLFISLDPDLSIRTQYQLDFARDYSGLTYDRHRDSFWVLSGFVA